MKNVFFSFHYGKDISRVNVVRNSWVLRGNKGAGFIDKAEFEKIKARGDNAVYKWIDEQLKGTSVTAVLIGEETCKRKFVRYELQQSYIKGNKIVGIYIHNIKNLLNQTSKKGDIDFGILGKDNNENNVYFHEIAKTYDWIKDNGYKNFGKWISEN